MKLHLLKIDVLAVALGEDFALWLWVGGVGRVGVGTGRRLVLAGIVPCGVDAERVLASDDREYEERCKHHEKKNDDDWQQ